MICGSNKSQQDVNNAEWVDIIKPEMCKTSSDLLLYVLLEKQTWRVYLHVYNEKENFLMLCKDFWLTSYQRQLSSL